MAPTTTAAHDRHQVIRLPLIPAVLAGLAAFWLSPAPAQAWNYPQGHLRRAPICRVVTRPTQGTGMPERRPSLQERQALTVAFETDMTGCLWRGR